MKFWLYAYLIQTTPTGVAPRNRFPGYVGGANRESDRPFGFDGSMVTQTEPQKHEDTTGSVGALGAFFGVVIYWSFVYTYLSFLTRRKM